MKTLDEVIKAWSICFSDNSRSNCTGCPYADDDGEAACFNHDREDALHYLKEYREQKELNEHIYAEYKRRAEMYEDWKNEQALAELPLSWDELRQMEGKPVWVEERSCRLWIIARNFQRVQYGNIDTEWLRTDIREIYYDKADLGKTWQAYRKQR